MVDGRALDDDGAVLLKFDNGAAGVLMASQVAAGEENALKIRVYGEKGGLEWAQHEPNTLLVKWLDQPTQILRAGGNYGDRLSSFATHNCRTPGGHPEGYLEAFGNIYRNFALTVSARIDGTTLQKKCSISHRQRRASAGWRLLITWWHRRLRMLSGRAYKFK
jgi:predicted dehydrogenase